MNLLIGHQAVCMNPAFISLSLLLHDFQKYLKIKIIPVNFHPANASRHQMIARTGIPLTFLSCYGIDILLFCDLYSPILT